MSSLLLVDINASNITNIRWIFEPLTNLMGSLAIPFLFLLTVLVVWKDVPSTSRAFLAFGLLAMFGFIAYGIFDPAVGIFLQLLTAIPMSIILYFGLVKRGRTL